MSDIVIPVSLENLSLDLLNNSCIPSNQWHILESFRNQFEKKMEKILEDNENYKKDIR
jgi:hypothetical protein